MLLKKELRVGVLNGCVWVFVIGVFIYFWFNDGMLSLIIIIVILFNLVVVLLLGVVILFILDKFKIDFVFLGFVIFIIVIDIVGFVIFFGLGSLLLF